MKIRDFYELDRLVFKKINFKEHKEICLKFRADSFFTSFGTDAAFWEEDGKGGERYIQWLQEKDPKTYGSFHIWYEQKIIGQIELGVFHSDSSFGYINLFYLAPDYRGKGFSKTLNHFAIQFLKELGLKKSKLCVSPTNKRAWNYYVKNGWQDKGPRKFENIKNKSKQPLVHWMEIEF